MLLPTTSPNPCSSTNTTEDANQTRKLGVCPSLRWSTIVYHTVHTSIVRRQVCVTLNRHTVKISLKRVDLRCNMAGMLTITIPN